MKIKKIIALTGFALLSVGILAGCSGSSDVIVDQGVYKMNIASSEDASDTEIALRVASEELNKVQDMKPKDLMFYDLESVETASQLKSQPNVYALITKYRDGETNQSTYAIDAVYKNMAEANESFPIVEQTIPTKVIKSFKKGDTHLVVVALEEADGKVSNATVVTVADSSLYKKDGYYMMKVKFSGPNVKVLSIEEETIESVYNKYHQTQKELTTAS